MAVWVPQEPPARELKGYRFVFVRSCGFVFYFSSAQQMQHCIEVLGTRHLPTSLQLSRQLGPDWGPNQHWLSRLPGDLKGWKKRRRIVNDLEKMRAHWS